MNLAVSILLFALGMGLACSGCRTPRPTVAPVYRWPAGHEATCERALERARACILRKGGKIKQPERGCVVAPVTGQRAEGQWAYYDTRQGWVGALYIPFVAAVAVSPDGSEINEGALRHELTHHLTGEPGHSERLKECYCGEGAK